MDQLCISATCSYPLQARGQFSDEGQFLAEGQFLDEGQFLAEGQFLDQGQFLAEGQFLDQGQFWVLMWVRISVGQFLRPIFEMKHFACK